LTGAAQISNLWRRSEQEKNMLSADAAAEARRAAEPNFLDDESETAQDWAALAAHLAEHGFHFEPKADRPRQFAGGFGNLNYLIRVDGAPAVLRRPPMGDIPPGANDMKREDRILSRLWRAFPLAPRSLHYSPDKEILGNHFLIMEYRAGLTIGGVWPEFLAGRDDIGAGLGDMLVDTLVAFHAVKPEEVDLGEFGRPAGFLRRAVAGWRQRMELSSDEAPPPIGVAVADWLEANQVPDGAPTLLHNDFKLDNVLLDPGTLAPVAVLDWDQGTRGDPLFDLATLLSYWTEPGDPPAMHDLAQMPSAGNGFPTRAGIVRRYAERSGRDVSDILFHRVLAMFKLGVIFMQIHAQYRRGTSSDPRFARFGDLTVGLMDFAHDVARGHAT
jgi:aminoglycoside phosphotransferase (APT) family kinase protein